MRKESVYFYLFQRGFPSGGDAASNMSIASRPKLGRNSLFFTRTSSKKTSMLAEKPFWF